MHRHRETVHAQHSTSSTSTWSPAVFFHSVIYRGNIHRPGLQDAYFIRFTLSLRGQEKKDPEMGGTCLRTHSTRKSKTEFLIPSLSLFSGCLQRPSGFPPNPLAVFDQYPHMSQASRRAFSPFATSFPLGSLFTPPMALNKSHLHPDACQFCFSVLELDLEIPLLTQHLLEAHTHLRSTCSKHAS